MMMTLRRRLGRYFEDGRRMWLSQDRVKWWALVLALSDLQVLLHWC